MEELVVDAEAAVQIVATVAQISETEIVSESSPHLTWAPGKAAALHHWLPPYPAPTVGY